MKQLALLVLGMGLVGCQFCRTHETVCAVGVGVVAVGLELSFENRGMGKSSDPKMSTPLTPDCRVYPEMCK